MAVDAALPKGFGPAGNNPRYFRISRSRARRVAAVPGSFGSRGSGGVRPSGRAKPVPRLSGRGLPASRTLSGVGEAGKQRPSFGGGRSLRRLLVRRRWSGCPAVLDHWNGRCRFDLAPSSSGDGRSPSPCRGAGPSGTAKPLTRFCGVPRPREVRLRTAGGQGGDLFGGRFSGPLIRRRALRRRLTGGGSSERRLSLVRNV